MGESNGRGPSSRFRQSQGVGEIRRLRRRIFSVLALSRLAQLLIGWSLVLGTAALGLRSVFDFVPLTILAVGSAAIPILGIASLDYARRRVPSRERLLAFLDNNHHRGGLVMASAEADLGSWQDSAFSGLSATVRWRGRGLLVSLAVVYLAAGLMLPVGSFAGFGGAGRLDVGREVEQMSAEVHTLQEIELLDDQTADSLVFGLQEIAENASSSDPESTFESLDRIARELAQLAAGGLEEALQKNEALTEAEALAEALKLDPDGLGKERLAEATQVLADLAKELELSDPADLVEKLSAVGAQIPPGLLSELSEALAKSREQNVGRLVELENIRFISADDLKKCTGSGCKKGDGLVAFLTENPGKTASDAVTLWCQLPGGGGVDRGPGDAPLLFGDETEKAGARFKEQILPPARFEELERAQLVGVSEAAPELDLDAVITGGALTDETSSGGSAVTRQLLPHHRDAVRRYFERKKQGER